MRSSHSVVLERNTPVEGVYQSEPYEAGWATEAIWFIEPLDPLACLWRARLQISPDGLRWCDQAGDTSSLSPQGLTAIPLVHFGNWIRIVLEPSDPGAVTRLMLTLVLK